MTILSLAVIESLNINYLILLAKIVEYVNN